MRPASTNETSRWPDQRSDAEVIGASLQVPEAFATIFDRHFDPIHGYLCRRLGDAGDDAAADVFVVAFERRASFDLERRDALPWLYGIASNLVLAGYRRARRDAALLDRVRGAGSSPSSPDPQLRLDQGDPIEVAAMERLVRELSDDDRDTLVLYAWEDLSYWQVAEALDVPVGTVRSRLHRIRRLGRELAAAPVTSTWRPTDDRRSRRGR